MKSRGKIFLAVVYTCLIAGFPSSSIAAGVPSPPTGLTIGEPPPPTIPPPGNDGLLSGMTPANYRIPAGWTSVITQNFEGGLSGNEGMFASFTSAKSHTGSQSIRGYYGGDGAEVKWWLNNGVIGQFTEAYVSWYEFIDSQARQNDEFWLARFLKRGPAGQLNQEFIMAWLWGGFNTTTAELYMVPQTDNPSIGRTDRFGGSRYTVPVGRWVQWEVHYRPSTGGLANGFIRIYQDGVLLENAENKNINNVADMSDMSIDVGGVYTKLTWVLDGGACSSSFGQGTDSGPRVTDFSSSCPCPNQCPPSGTVPTFNRYYDDIIVMKK